MIFTQLLQSRDELRKKFLGTKELQKDSQDSSDTVKDQQTPVKNAQTSTVTTEETVATKLLEVIDELEKAHEAIDEKAIMKSQNYINYKIKELRRAYFYIWMIANDYNEDD